MTLVRFLIRILLVVAGAIVGLALFLIAVITFATFLLISLLRGRKPNLQFRVNKNPWAQRRQPVGDVVDVEVREVRDAPPLPLRPPEQR